MATINRLFVAIAISLLGLCLFVGSAIAADTGDIVIRVTGLRNNNGAIRIALFNSPKAYSADKFSADTAFQKLVVPVKNNEATATIENIPYGDYAIKLFHDEDNSGRFITNAFGIPKVEYGFSNNAHGMFGPASYEKAKFKLQGKRLNMTIKIQG